MVMRGAPAALENDRQESAHDDHKTRRGSERALRSMSQSAEPSPRLHLAARAGEQPEAPAIIMGVGGEVVSYRELDEGSARLAGFLRHQGLVPGDHVTILMENC